MSGWNLDNSYAHLPQILFTPQNPVPVRSPRLVVLNERLAKELGLNVELLYTKGVDIFSGNALPPNSFPLAQAYAGHQFGYFTMLGDGRAILLGEQVTPSGERYDIQLKGSGRTVYSRRGDGRAALGPMLREYIISEAMHALKIPTTQSLAVVSTGETIMRDTELPGAILARVAKSHIRVGTFQYVSRWGSIDDLRSLADYTMHRHYPEIEAKDYIAFLHSVIARQAKLIAQWQLIGFVHGVMNTDNMAISGETIDYGPCAFMDAYDPSTVFSSIDVHGRYAYGNQPRMAAWNLARFAESLLPLLHENREEAIEIAQKKGNAFNDLFHYNWLSGMRAKLGITNEDPEDKAIIDTLLSLMHRHQADFTNTFRALTFDRLEGEALFEAQEFVQWRERWLARTKKQIQAGPCRNLMRSSNPAIIPRNHRVEEALEAAERGDIDVMHRLLKALANPYAHTAEQEEYAAPSGKSYRTFCGT